MTTRRNLLRKSALIGGATVAAPLVHAGYEVTKDEFQNAMSEHVIDWNDHYTNYRFILESKSSVVDEVPQRLFNEVMSWMFDHNDIQVSDEYSSDHISRLHHAWDIANMNHENLINDYRVFYTLLAWGKPKIWDYAKNIAKPSKPTSIKDTFKLALASDEKDEFIQFINNDFYYGALCDGHLFLMRNGLYDEYQKIFSRVSHTDTLRMDGFLESWGLASYIEFRNNNGL